MEKVKYIFVHHAGGLGNNNYASTRHLTPEDIEDYHKLRWNMRSSLGKYAGYNFIYDPKTRKFTEHRQVGEETMAVRGFNFNSIHICIIGNYNKKYPRGNELVDPMTQQMEEDITDFILKLCRDYNISKSNIHAHKWASSTMCNGTGLREGYFRDLAYDYKLPKDKTSTEITYDPSLITDIHKLIILLIGLLKSGILKVGGKKLGSSEREDPDNINE